jgi:AraC-like DNA-binding protein
VHCGGSIQANYGEVSPVHATPAARAVERGVDYIEANLSEPLQLSAIAEAACMSRFHFARMFREQTGLSPMEYLRMRRIERARQLLHADGQRIGQIANALGFYDQSHFVRWFRRSLGCTPSAYLQDARADRPCR